MNWKEYNIEKCSIRDELRPLVHRVNTRIGNVGLGSDTEMVEFLKSSKMGRYNRKSGKWELTMYRHANLETLQKAYSLAREFAYVPTEYQTRQLEKEYNTPRSNFKFAQQYLESNFGIIVGTDQIKNIMDDYDEWSDNDFWNEIGAIRERGELTEEQKENYLRGGSEFVELPF